MTMYKRGCNLRGIDWYQVLYDCKDQKLIDLFWYKFNHSKVKSKKRIARAVLIHYYSTTPTDDLPVAAYKALVLPSEIKLCREVNIWESVE